jgi:hypothetical protein
MLPPAPRTLSSSIRNEEEYFNVAEVLANNPKPKQHYVDDFRERLDSEFDQQ